MIRPLIILIVTCAMLNAEHRSSGEVPPPQDARSTQTTASSQSRQSAEVMLCSTSDEEIDAEERDAKDKNRATEVDPDKAKTEFEKQDKALNAAYATAKKSLNTELFEKLKNDQREWLKERAARSGLDDPDRSDEWPCALAMTENRVEWIKAWALMSETTGWSGHYTDGRGGWIDIAEKDGRYYFSIAVQRYYGTRGECTGGSIEGKLRINGSTGWFETKADEESDPTWLTFLREMDFTNSIRIAEENTISFTGRASFQGTYLWARELTVQERRSVLMPKK